MAKAVHKNNNINDIFNGDADLRISKDRHTAVYEDDLTAGKLVFKGSNLTRETGTEYFSGGTIRQLLITDENNDFAFRLTGLKISASDLPHNYTTGNLTGLLSTLRLVLTRSSAVGTTTTSTATVVATAFPAVWVMMTLPVVPVTILFEGDRGATSSTSFRQLRARAGTSSRILMCGVRAMTSITSMWTVTTRTEVRTAGAIP
jgi:hypothetical protein